MPEPTLASGKICYLQIPARDIAQSSAFYRDVFGWPLRTRGDGAVAFDDTTGQVSGVWVLGRPPSTTPGLLIYIMVANAARTIETALAHGATLVQPIGADHPEITARIADPAGNVIGIYQERTLSTPTPHTPTTSKPFTISRTVNAPRSIVWECWTKRDELMQWFGPKGMPMTHAELDFRVGGTFLYCLRMPDGRDLWGKFTYREITPTERLVFVNQFSNKDGGLGRHPLAPEWPPQMLTTVTFTERNNQTTIHIEWSTLNATPAEQAMFDKSHDGMTMGWTGTFENLDNYLANR